MSMYSIELSCSFDGKKEVSRGGKQILLFQALLSLVSCLVCLGWDPRPFGGDSMSHS